MFASKQRLNPVFQTRQSNRTDREKGLYLLRLREWQEALVEEHFTKTGLRPFAGEYTLAQDIPARSCDRLRCRYSAVSNLKCSGITESHGFCGLRTNRTNARCRVAHGSDHRLPLRLQPASR